MGNIYETRVLLKLVTYLNKIIVMQNKFVRIITRSHYQAHTEPIFKSLMLLKLCDIYKLQISKYVYAFIRNELPITLMHLFTLSQDTHAHNTRHSVTYKLKVRKFVETVS